MQRRRDRGAAVVSALAVVLADSSSRMLVAGAHAGAGSYVPNPGLALGSFAGPPLLLITGSIVVLIVFLGVVGRWAIQVGISPIIPGVIAGGAIANALDRAQFGVVRDFLPTPWLVIDVGDIAVVAGILALGLAAALRLHQLRASSQTIKLDVRNLRAVVVPVGAR